MGQGCRCLALEQSAINPMWLCTTLGFFSIVKKGQPGEWQVRARVKHDLENLLSTAKLNLEIIVSPNADYRFRIVLEHDQLLAVFSVLAGSIDYGNFKDEIGRRKDQRTKLDAYHEFWGAMLEVQHATRDRAGSADDLG
jgi:hypothetical protein